MSTRLLVRPIGSREGKKNIAGINLAWDYVFAMYSKIQVNLSDLTQKVLKFPEISHVRFPVTGLVPSR